MADTEYQGEALPPEKLEAAAKAYGWLATLQEEISVAMADLAKLVPEEHTERARARAKARAGAFHYGRDFSGTRDSLGLTGED